MIEEPYRWLEAIANRREYIREQLTGATPVFAFSRPEGVLLIGVGAGQSNVFEIYDRHAMAALGHPVDIERIRQTAIEAAHLEGFTRAPEDVTLRRLLNFSIGPALKTSFEQIFAAPIIVESIFTEVGPEAAADVLARVSFDGSHRLVTGGVAIAHTPAADAAAAAEWLQAQLAPEAPPGRVLGLALTAWQALTTGKPFAPPAVPEALPRSIDGRTIEAGLLDRRIPSRARYRPLNPAALP